MPLPSSPQYSTLELARHDASAGAPERDNAIVAPEYARELDAPQTAFVCDPETLYNNSLPEAVVGIEGEVKTPSTNRPENASRRWSRRTQVISVLLATAVILGIALGVGLGEGLKQQSPRPASNVTGTNVTGTNVTGTNVTGTNSSEPTIGVAQRLSQNQILADTSLAIVASSDGGRRLFFQEQSGNVREAIYSPSTRIWTATSNSVVASDAKNHTPIAAVTDIFDSFGGLEGPKPIAFYISKNNTLVCQRYNDEDNNWSIDDVTSTICSSGPLGFTAADSRHLSATVITKANISYVLLLYESPTRAVVTLNGSFVKPGIWQWKNLSNIWERGSGFELSAPFVISYENPASGGSAWFASKNQTGRYTDTLVIAKGFDPVEDLAYDSANVSPTIYGDLASTDWSVGPIEYNVFWVNGTGLNSTAGGYFATRQPSSSFPYARLASFTDNNFNFSLYHQMNSTTFAIDYWNPHGAGWTMESISVDVT